jgi:hypothetical protein
MEEHAFMSDRTVALLEQILELQQEQLDITKQDAERRKRAFRYQQIHMRVWGVLVAFLVLAILFVPVIVRSMFVEAP